MEFNNGYGSEYLEEVFDKCSGHCNFFFSNLVNLSDKITIMDSFFFWDIFLCSDNIKMQ